MLDRLSDLEVPALIVDVRGNGGGAAAPPPYFAGSFSDDAFDLYELVFADETGALGRPVASNVESAPVRWWAPVAVLIDEDCASACEIFAAAMAHDPAHLIVGQYPTAAVEASVFLWNLPDNLYFQASLGLLWANGEVFLEGRGVPPTLDVPVTRESLTGDADVVLAAAEAALLSQPGDANAMPLARATPAVGATPAAVGSPAVTPVLAASPVTVPAP